METGANGVISLTAMLNVEEVNKPELDHVTTLLPNMVETSVCCQVTAETGIKKKRKQKSVTCKNVQVILT